MCSIQSTFRRRPEISTHRKPGTSAKPALRNFPTKCSLLGSKSIAVSCPGFPLWDRKLAIVAPKIRPLFV